MLILPTRTDLPRYTFAMELEGTVYVFGLDYNDRDGAWYMSISTEDSTPLVLGRALRLGTLFLGDKLRSPGLPAGDFVLFDSSSGDVDPGLSDLGDRVSLVYLSADEVP